MKPSITAVIPIKGRLPLLKHTIERLVRTGVSVVCCGHSYEELELCEASGARFITCPETTPLGAKWQDCINLARDVYDSDAIQIMGSSDFVSENWNDVLFKDFEEQGCGMTGTSGIFFVDIRKFNKKSMIFWGGYHGVRCGEPIGTGRLIGRKMLDLLDWQLFDRDINNSLDYSTMRRMEKVKDKWKGEMVYCNPSKEIKALSISTYRWVNKHNFLRESVSPTAVVIDNPDEILSKYFPEVLNLFGE